MKLHPVAQAFDGLVVHGSGRDGGAASRRGQGRSAGLVVLLTLVASLLAVASASPSAADHPTSEFARVGSITLPGAENRLETAVIDPAGEFAYYSTRTSPGVVKVDLTTFARVGWLALPGDEGLYSAVMDPAGAFAYFGTTTSPGRVVKIDLATFTRVGALTLDAGEDDLYSAVIDPTGDFAYFGTAVVGSPGRVVKVDLDTFTRVGAIVLPTGEEVLQTAAIDPAGAFAYFTTSSAATAPSKVVKIDLAGFTRVEALTLAAGENNVQSAVVDPAGGFAYFGTGTLPGRVVKVDLARFTRAAAITLPTDDGAPLSAVMDPAGESAYFGTGGQPSEVVKIDLVPFSRVSAISLPDPDEILLVSAVIDPAGEFAYFGTGHFNAGRIIKIHLRDAFERTNRVTLPAAEKNIESAVIDPAGEFAYFGTIGSPASIVKIALATLTRIDAITLNSTETVVRVALVDPSGTYAYFGVRSSLENRIVKVDLATFTRVGTITLVNGGGLIRSAVIDPAGTYAYFGTGARPGRVVKVDLATFTEVDTVIFNGDDPDTGAIAESEVTSAVIDPAGEFAYFATGIRGAAFVPARVVKVDLDTFERVGAVEVEADGQVLTTAVMDPAGQYAYFGMSIAPGKIVKIDLATFSRVGAVTLTTGEDFPQSAVIDPAGDFAYFGAAGRVVKVDLSTFERADGLTLPPDEINLRSAVIDPSGSFAYFGASGSTASGDTRPGHVVEVRLRLDPAPDPTPTVSVAADVVTVDEGSAASNGGTVADPDAVLAASVGTVTATGGGTWAWTFTPADGPVDGQQVEISATDGDGQVTTVTFELVVDNVAPDVQAAVVDPGGAEAGASSGFSIAAGFSDPGGDADEPYSCVVDWGDGSTSAGAADGTTCSLTESHTYSAVGTYDVTVAVTDKDGDTGTSLASLVVVVDTTPPTVTLTTAAQDAAYVVDDVVTSDYSCTDGGSGVDSCVGDLADDATIPTDTVGAFSFTVTGTDNAGNVTVVTHDYTVVPADDQAPTVTDIAPGTAPVATQVTVTATVDDSATGGSNVVSAEYRLDGGAWSTMSAADGAFDGPVEGVTATIGPFTDPAVHELCVRGTDSAGNTGAPECGLLAVFDPSAGFVTGGGWIESPAGASTAFPDAIGRATFGFVSRYQKGAKVPTGDTQFRFIAGNLDFRSTSYEWLVIAGARATYKGSGAINGSGDYGFLLTAVDSGVTGGGDHDAFRIKIVDKTTGDVVYDNDPSDGGQALGGGSIQIHVPKKR